jgi:hypothetical protein
LQYKAGCTVTKEDGYVPRDAKEGQRLRKEYITLWREGLKRWQPKGVLQALVAPHWDDPAVNVLECRHIHRPGEVTVKAVPGTPYALSFEAR